MSNHFFNVYYTQKKPNYLLENLPENGLKDQDLREFAKYLSGAPESVSDDEQQDLKKLINIFIKDNPNENYNYLPAYGTMSFLGFCMAFTPLNKENLDNLYYNHSQTLNLKNEERLYLMTYLIGKDNKKNSFSHDPKRIPYNQRKNALKNIEYLEEYKFKPIVGANHKKEDLYEFFIKENLEDAFAKIYRKLINVDFKKEATYSCYNFLTEMTEKEVAFKYEKIKNDISDLFYSSNKLSFPGYNELVIKNQKFFNDIPYITNKNNNISDEEKMIDYIQNELFIYILDHHTGYTEEDKIELAIRLTERMQTLSYEANLKLGEYFSLCSDEHIDRLYDVILSSGYANISLESYRSSFDYLIDPVSCYFYTFVEKRDLLNNLDSQLTSELSSLQVTKRRI